MAVQTVWTTFLVKWQNRVLTSVKIYIRGDENIALALSAWQPGAIRPINHRQTLFSHTRAPHTQISSLLLIAYTLEGYPSTRIPLFAFHTKYHFRTMLHRHLTVCEVLILYTRSHGTQSCHHWLPCIGSSFSSTLEDTKAFPRCSGFWDLRMKEALVQCWCSLSAALVHSSTLHRAS